MPRWRLQRLAAIDVPIPIPIRVPPAAIPREQELTAAAPRNPHSSLVVTEVAADVTVRATQLMHIGNAIAPQVRATFVAIAILRLALHPLLITRVVVAIPVSPRPRMIAASIVV